VWRDERDFFYDPGLHGVNREAIEKQYLPYVANIGSRNDLNYLFEEMLGEMTVGHMFVGGGDQPDVKRVRGGLLGADYTVENGRYRFARVYNGENWNPNLNAPLTQPGVNVVAGEYLLAVQGRLKHALTLIERRLGEPLSLRDVARELGMTPAHLTTVVRRRTGRAVGEWIIERRMAEARALLAETDLPIAEVARRVGMHDAGYFSRLFGRTHGTSPRNWRNRPAPG